MSRSNCSLLPKFRPASPLSAHGLRVLLPLHHLSCSLHMSWQRTGCSFCWAALLPAQWAEAAQGWYRGSSKSTGLGGGIGEMELLLPSMVSIRCALRTHVWLPAGHGIFRKKFLRSTFLKKDSDTSNDLLLRRQIEYVEQDIFHQLLIKKNVKTLIDTKS